MTYNNKNRKLFNGYYLFIILFSLFISGCGEQKESSKENNSIHTDTVLQQKDSVIKITDTTRITSAALTSAYVANEVKADADFKGKIIFVTGIIQDIKKGITGDIYVILKGSETFRAVQCSFENEPEAQKLEKGMTATFKGKCDGLMANVILLDCELLSKTK